MSGESAQNGVNVSSAGIPQKTYRGQLVVHQTPADVTGASVADTVNVTFVGVAADSARLAETRYG